VPATLGLKLGGSTTYGEETIPFYKLQYLGQINNLRGFDNNRFTGKSTTFFNSELRIRLAKFKTSFLPLEFGAKGFYDVGRVFSEFDVNNDWKNAHGFGFYLVPLTSTFSISVSASFSEEAKGAILIGIGSSFN